VEQFSGVSSVKNLAEISNLTTAFLSEIFKKKSMHTIHRLPGSYHDKNIIFLFFCFFCFQFQFLYSHAH
jgi:hypothetical protein